MGLFSFVSGLLGAGAQKKATKKAAADQVAALNRAIDVTKQQFDTTDQELKPYRDEGATGLSQYGDLVGTHGAAPQQSAIDALKASPFYQSLFRTGEETVLQDAAATGGVRGGNTQRSLADFGSDTLMKTIMQQLQSLSGLAGLGLNATTRTGQFGADAAGNIAGFNTDQGKALASKDLAIGGINSQMWNNAGSFLDQAVSAFLPGGGGFSSLLKSGGGF
jgi:hypothetical protein